MKFKRFIADGGGTKTDWCGVDEQGNLHRFSTESYHLLKADDEFITRQLEFWQQHDVSECFLHFYGAGCLRVENQQKMQFVFESIGFQETLVESDLFAAARAVDNEDVMIAICGTGSVLFKVEHDQLIELRGGLGWEQGDEGSGFYFGKLLLERLEDDKKDKYPEIRNVISQWKSTDELRSMQNQSESKSVYSQLPALLASHCSHPLIASVHVENIQLFLERYAKDCLSIGFVGSYAFYIQNYFKLACESRNIEIFTFVERPMDSLVKRLLD